jgi:hypothetical protein
VTNGDEKLRAIAAVGAVQIHPMVCRHALL